MKKDNKQPDDRKNKTYDLSIIAPGMKSAIQQIGEISRTSLINIEYIRPVLLETFRSIELTKPVITEFARSMSIFSEQLVKLNYLGNISQIMEGTINIYNQNVKYLSNSLKVLTEQMDFSNMFQNYENILNSFNFENVVFNENGTIEYEDEIFNKEDIDEATKELSTNSSISKDRKQSIVQKILLFILSAYICGIIGQAGAETYTHLKDRFLGIYADVQSYNNEDNYFNEKCRIVDVSELNIRESFSKDSKIIGKLYYLQLVKELEKVAYWTKIEYLDEENHIKIIGWVSTRCIKSYNKLKNEFSNIEE